MVNALLNIKVIQVLILVLLVIAQLAVCYDVETGYVMKTGYNYDSTVVKQQYSVTNLWRCLGICLKSDVCVAINARCSGVGPGCECDFLADVATGIEQLTEEVGSTYIGPRKCAVIYRYCYHVRKS